MHLSNQILSHACFMSCSSLCCLTALLHFLVSPSLRPSIINRCSGWKNYMRRECFTDDE